MKARVLNVERSYEALKLKFGIIEEEKARLEEVNKKLVDDANKQRTLRSKAEKELEALKSSSVETLQASKPRDASKKDRVEKEAPQTVEAVD